MQALVLLQQHYVEDRLAYSIYWAIAGQNNKAVAAAAAAAAAVAATSNFRGVPPPPPLLTDGVHECVSLLDPQLGANVRLAIVS